MLKNHKYTAAAAGLSLRVLRSQPTLRALETKKKLKERSKLAVAKRTERQRGWPGTETPQEPRAARCGRERAKHSNHEREEPLSRGIDGARESSKLFAGAKAVCGRSADLRAVRHAVQRKALHRCACSAGPCVAERACSLRREDFVGVRLTPSELSSREKRRRAKSRRKVITATRYERQQTGRVETVDTHYIRAPAGRGMRSGCISGRGLAFLRTPRWTAARRGSLALPTFLFLSGAGDFSRCEHGGRRWRGVVI